MHLTARLAALSLAALGLTTPLAAEPRVVTDIGPTHALVAQVMAGVGDPVLLVDRGGDPHTFQLRPSQMRALDGADLLIWIGPGLTPWLADLAGSAQRSVELAEVPGLNERPPMFAEAHDEEGADHGDHEEHADHEDDEDHKVHGADEAHDDHGDHAHDHGAHDPHIWLDPQNGKAMLAAIAAELAAADPANATRYAANANTAAAALDALDAEIAAALAPYRDRPLIVFHDAYAHLAGRFGLTIAGALAETDAADPGAATVRRLTALAAEGGADCAFAEPQHSDGVLRGLAADTGLRIGRLDPEGTSLPPGPDLYADLLRAMAAEIATCLAAP